MKKLLFSVALFFVWVVVLYLIPVDLGIDKKTENPNKINVEQSLFSIDINEIQTIPTLNIIDPSLCSHYIYFYNTDNKTIQNSYTKTDNLIAAM